MAGTLPRRARASILGIVAVITATAVLLGVDALVVVGRIPTVETSLPEPGRVTTYLLVGSDSRERLTTEAARRRYKDAEQATGERADVLVLLRVPDEGRPSALNIPRDLVLGLGRGAPRRVGMSLDEGPQELVDVMCEDLGITVNHLLIADFPAFTYAVDRLGGIPVTTPGPLRDAKAKLHLPHGGRQMLSGEEALAYVRSRHTQQKIDGVWRIQPGADPSRREHMVEVMTKLGRKARNHPWSAHQALWAAGPHLRRDPGFGVRESLALARALTDVAEGDLMTDLPVALTDTHVPLAMWTDETEPTLDRFRSGPCDS